LSQRHWLQLALTEGLGPILTTRLIEVAGGAEAASRADARMLRAVEGIGPNKATAIYDSLRAAGDEVDKQLRACADANVSLICLDDAGYPAILRAIPDPPPLLYVKGTLEDRDMNAMAIVGSRKCSYYGREQAERFAALLAPAGLTIVSGGARGIDSAAHRGALSHPLGRTIAVLGCGVDQVYPPENAALFEQIAGRGAIVSEFPLGTPPLRENFPRRNRLISGLSRGVLVIEADTGSGALITARHACEDHNRPVFAVPGRVDNPLSAGPHALIRDGAVLTTGLDDILENLGPLPEQAHRELPAPAEDVEEPGSLPEVEEQPMASLNDRCRKLLAEISSEPADIDSLIARTDLPAEVVFQELTLLSLRGVVRRVEGNKFVRRLSKAN
jgi:DNA processing protein